MNTVGHNRMNTVPDTRTRMEPVPRTVGHTVRVFDVNQRNLEPIYFICGRVQRGGIIMLQDALAHLELVQDGVFEYHDNEGEGVLLTQTLHPLDGSFMLNEHYHRHPIPLGVGTYGRVYVAWQNDPNKKFVLKIISLLKFRRQEIEIPSLYPHASSAHQLGISWDKENVYLYQELIEGDHLQRLVEASGPLKDNEVLFVLNRLLNLLRYWHGFNVVHRDIKPNNIIVSNDGRKIKIIDFGSSNTLKSGSDGNVEERFSLHGTELYMSPEMCNNSGHNHLTDVYSTGCVAIFLSLGQPPFYREIQSGTFGAPIFIIGSYPQKIMSYVDEIKNNELREFIRLMVAEKGKRLSANELLDNNILKIASPHGLSTAIDRASVVQEYESQTSSEYPGNQDNEVADAGLNDDLSPKSMGYEALSHLDDIECSGNLPNLQELQELQEVDVMSSTNEEGAVGGVPATKVFHRGHTTDDSGVPESEDSLHCEEDVTDREDHIASLDGLENSVEVPGGVQYDDDEEYKTSLDYTRYNYIR